MSDQFLVLFDADRIRDYVFTSGRLREIRGASERVRQLTDPGWLKKHHGAWKPDVGAEGGVIFAGGGAGGVVVAGEGAARELCASLERRFRRGTAGATLSAVYERIIPGDPCAEADAQQRAARSLASRKASRPRAQFMPGGLVRACASDRIHPAAGSSPAPGSSDPYLVSHGTATRRSESRTWQTSLPGREFWRVFTGHMGGHTQAKEWERAIHPSQDLSSIGLQSKPEGYVGLVYADGDRIGQAFRHIVAAHGFAGYRDLSEALDTSAHHAVGTAMYRAYGAYPPPVLTRLASANDPEPRALPFEVVTVGGDDMLLICTAGHALEVACTLASEFSEEMTRQMEVRELDLSPVKASVGVVIAHDSMPILTLERMGRELLKSAKEAPEAGGIDFHFATASGVDHLSTSRARDYQTDSTELPALTQRPYSLSLASTLLAYAKEVRFGDDPLPGSKIAELIDACRGDDVTIALNVLGIHSRLTRAQQEVLTRALKELSCVNPYPFNTRPAEGHMSTALLDLLEASEFIDEPWGRAT